MRHVYLKLSLAVLLFATWAEAQSELDQAYKAFRQHCRSTPRQEQGISYHYEFPDGSRLSLVVINDAIAIKRANGKNAREAEGALKKVRTMADASAALRRSYNRAEPYTRVSCEGQNVFFDVMEIQGGKIISRPAYAVPPGQAALPGQPGAPPQRPQQPPVNYTEIITSFETRKKASGKLTNEDLRTLKRLRESIETSKQMTPDFDKRLRALDPMSSTETRF